MYLTQIALDPRHPSVRRDLASAYELHRTLRRAASDAEEERLLYRLEPGQPGGPHPTLLVQTLARPDWSFLDAGYALALRGPKPFDLALREGQPLAFRLIANPTRRAVSARDATKKTRVPLKKDTKTPNKPEHRTYFEWLLDQAHRCGFNLPHSDDGVPAVQAAPFHIVTRKGVGGDPSRMHRITLFGVRFDGVLTVTDPDRLVEAVRRGIGPAKAFGFGLLSLAPAR
ncbi:MAG TPA: type I-E CRISPR-associated protein Cas6/Cse3/CasE [Rubricoccaceae bacterium]|nr:type I-E CRISPR-associated protein Cas6/Cse3/CasE [Rubricoccaceae bacterium]